MKKHIPNFLTVCNLLCGCIGIVKVFEGDIHIAAYLIWIAAFFDFLDGFAARMLKVKSAIGKELDSLADMVTFGVLPSMILYVLIDERTENTFLPYLAFTIAVFSALRLAKFNIDDTQEEAFIGLPTPANAFFFSAFPFIIERNFLDLNSYLGAGVLSTICIIFSILLVSDLRLFSFKFKDFSWENNGIRYIFVMISLVMLIIFNVVALPLIILTYLVLSVVARFLATTK
jgi:CDP-diacylglycerol--serine O-phosphatidyltransferase